MVKGKPKNKSPAKEVLELDNVRMQLDNRIKAYDEAMSNLHAALEGENPDTITVEDCLEMVRDVYEHLFIIQDKYNHLLIENDRRDDFILEDQKLIQLSMQMKTVEIRVKRLTRQLERQEFDNCSVNSASSVGSDGYSSSVRCGDSSSLRCGNTSGQRRKLPLLNLPKFAGDVRQWLPFWSQFKEIDKDETIATSDKFQYLLQSMVPDSEACRIILSYPLCEENYELALNNLKERYGRKDLLVKVYVRDLLRMVIENSQRKDNRNFSEVYTKLAAQIRALGSLGVTTDTCASIVYPVVESCLPEETLRAWQRDRGYKDASSSEDELKRLMEFLDKEVKGEDNIRLACAGLTADPSVNKPRGSNKDINRIPTAANLLSTESQEKLKVCLFCEQNHPTSKCGKAKALSLEDKNKIIREKKACFICLRIGHSKKMCKSFIQCINCGGKHETVMCHKLEHHQKKISQQQPRNSNISNQDLSSSSLIANSMKSPEVLLQTLMVKILCQNGYVEARALIDTGSQKSYLLKSLAESIGLKSLGEESVIHGLFGGSKSAEQKHKRYNIMLSHLEDSYHCDFIISDIPQITGRLNSIPHGPWLEELKSHKISVSDVNKSSEPVSILLGADVAGKLFTGRKVELASGPVAIETKLGWTVMGKLPISSEGNGIYTGLNQISDKITTMLHTFDLDIQKLWNLDVIGITDENEDKVAKNSVLRHFMETVTKNEEKRYEVKLPWISNHSPLPDNKWIAARRLNSTTEKLKKQGTLEKYDQLFKLWEQDGMIEEVSELEKDAFGHYLPHRAVYKPESTTTPIRPVFDASCRTQNQPSLNDCLECGPNLLEEIPVIITRFRLNRIGVIADIKKAFQQISVTPEDRDKLRFLWWKNLSCQDLKIYRHRRVVFGVNSSPFILGATLQHLMNTTEQKFNSTVDVLKKSLYVDNVAAAVDDFEAADKFRSEANEIMKSANFELRGWEIGPTTEERTVPLLGLTWNMKNDTMQCEVKSLEPEKIGIITKRKILAVAHTIFDPIGFTCPFTLIPKLILQEAWSLKTGWDTELPMEIQHRFLNWLDQVKILSELKIPRCITLLSTDKSKWSLHTFVDASKVAYAACIFLRIETNNNVSVQLLLAKSRVSPLKPMSIPRLELTSCVIGTRLTKMAKHTLEYEDIPTTYWSDSSTAVHWIQNRGNWGVFVQNRVEEIRRNSNEADWKHIPGCLNPADLPSRGASATQLVNLRWWEGSAWLYDTVDKWPKSQIQFNKEEIEKETRKNSVISSVNNEKYSNVITLPSYREMVQEMAKQDGCLEESPSTEAMKLAEEKLLKIVQDAAFHGEAASRIKKFEVYRDEVGIIRLKTRMDYGSFENSFKYPILLPQESAVTKAIILDEHVQNSHGGVQFLLATLRSRFWILNGRRTIRNVIKKCEVCQRFSVKSMQTQVPALPKERIQADSPFKVTGVDFAGPLFLNDGKKVWIAVFTCAVFRAVHMEVASSLSTEDFRLTLRRFVSRRGRPRIIFSDNGKNFVGLSNQLKKINWKKLQKDSEVSPIVWKFNPPTACWWGGWFERIIGVVKSLLRKVIGQKILKYEELVTVLCDVESVVNQRPITYVSEDPEDPKPLTSHMFIVGNMKSTLPEGEELERVSLNKRLRYLHRVREDFKRRFQNEYLGQLFSSSGKKETRIVKVGDTVLVGQDNMKRVHWPIGIIQELFPGKDGVVRLVKVKIGETEALRPIKRIYPFEISEDVRILRKDISVKTSAGGYLNIPEELTIVNV